MQVWLYPIPTLNFHFIPAQETYTGIRLTLSTAQIRFPPHRLTYRTSYVAAINVCCFPTWNLSFWESSQKAVLAIPTLNGWLYPSRTKLLLDPRASFALYPVARPEFHVLISWDVTKPKPLTVSTFKPTFTEVLDIFKGDNIIHTEEQLFEVGLYHRLHSCCCDQT